MLNFTLCVHSGKLSAGHYGPLKRGIQKKVKEVSVAGGVGFGGEGWGTTQRNQVIGSQQVATVLRLLPPQAQ